MDDCSRWTAQSFQPSNSCRMKNKTEQPISILVKTVSITVFDWWLITLLHAVCSLHHKTLSLTSSTKNGHKIAFLLCTWSEHFIFHFGVHNNLITALVSLNRYPLQTSLLAATHFQIFSWDNCWILSTHHHSWKEKSEQQAKEKKGEQKFIPNDYISVKHYQFMPFELNCGFLLSFHTNVRTRKMTKQPKNK